MRVDTVANLFAPGTENIGAVPVEDGEGVQGTVFYTIMNQFQTLLEGPPKGPEVQESADASAQSQGDAPFAAANLWVAGPFVGPNALDLPSGGTAVETESVPSAGSSLSTKVPRQPAGVFIVEAAQPTPSRPSLSLSAPPLPDPPMPEAGSMAATPAEPRPAAPAQPSEASAVAGAQSSLLGLAPGLSVPSTPSSAVVPAAGKIIAGLTGLEPVAPAQPSQAADVANIHPSLSKWWPGESEPSMPGATAPAPGQAVAVSVDSKPVDPARPSDTLVVTGVHPRIPTPSYVPIEASAVAGAQSSLLGLAPGLSVPSTPSSAVVPAAGKIIAGLTGLEPVAPAQPSEAAEVANIHPRISRPSWIAIDPFLPNVSALGSGNPAVSPANPEQADLGAVGLKATHATEVESTSQARVHFQHAWLVSEEPFTATEFDQEVVPIETPSVPSEENRLERAVPELETASGEETVAPRVSSRFAEVEIVSDGPRTTPAPVLPNRHVSSPPSRMGFKLQGVPTPQEQGNITRWTQTAPSSEPVVAPANDACEGELGQPSVHVFAKKINQPELVSSTALLEDLLYIVHSDSSSANPKMSTTAPPPSRPMAPPTPGSVMSTPPPIDAMQKGSEMPSGTLPQAPARSVQPVTDTAGAVNAPAGRQPEDDEGTATAASVKSKGPERENVDPIQPSKRTPTGPRIIQSETVTSSTLPNTSKADAPSQPQPQNTTGRSSEFLFQMADRMHAHLQNGAREIQIQLKPEDLGRLVIKAEDSAGGLVARILTESGSVKHFLESNLLTLQQALHDQGLRIDRIDVFVQEGLDARQSSGHQHSFSQPEARHHHANQQRTPEIPISASAILPDEIAVDPVTLALLGPNSTFHAIA